MTFALGAYFLSESPKSCKSDIMTYLGQEMLITADLYPSQAMKSTLHDAFFHEFPSRRTKHREFLGLISFNT